MKAEQKIYEIKGNQFPFGVFDEGEEEAKNMFAKKKYIFRSE
jgi:hypothetical protein